MTAQRLVIGRAADHAEDAERRLDPRRSAEVRHLELPNHGRPPREGGEVGIVEEVLPGNTRQCGRLGEVQDDAQRPPGAVGPRPRGAVQVADLAPEQRGEEDGAEALDPVDLNGVEAQDAGLAQRQLEDEVLERLVAEGRLEEALSVARR